MTGTEKQIEWAERIKAEITPKLDALAQSAGTEYLAFINKPGGLGSKRPEWATKTAAALARIPAMIANVLAEQSAAYWIDRRDMSAREILIDRAERKCNMAMANDKQDDAFKFNAIKNALQWERK